MSGSEPQAPDVAEQSHDQCYHSAESDSDCTDNCSYLCSVLPHTQRVVSDLALDRFIDRLKKARTS